MRTLTFHGAVLTTEHGSIVGIDSRYKQPAIDLALALFTDQNRVLVAGAVVVSASPIASPILPPSS